MRDREMSSGCRVKSRIRACRSSQSAAASMCGAWCGLVGRSSFALKDILLPRPSSPSRRRISFGEGGRSRPASPSRRPATARHRSELAHKQHSSSYIYLPPHSPQFNAIDKCWAWVKHWVRGCAPNSAERLAEDANAACDALPGLAVRHGCIGHQYQFVARAEHIVTARGLSSTVM